MKIINTKICFLNKSWGSLVSPYLPLNLTLKLLSSSHYCLFWWVQIRVLKCVVIYIGIVPRICFKMAKPEVRNAENVMKFLAGKNRMNIGVRGVYSKVKKAGNEVFSSGSGLGQYDLDQVHFRDVKGNKNKLDWILGNCSVSNSSGWGIFILQLWTYLNLLVRHANMDPHTNR